MPVSNELSGALINAARELSTAVDKLQFAPPVTHV